MVVTAAPVDHQDINLKACHFSFSTYVAAVASFVLSAVLTGWRQVPKLPPGRSQTALGSVT